MVLPEEEMEPNMPREYSISILPGEVQNKFVFSEDQNGGKAISGTVHHECAATPTQFNTYRNIMRKRVREAGTPQRSVQVLGQNNQPVFVPGASSSGLPNSSFSDFIVSTCNLYPKQCTHIIHRRPRSPRQTKKRLHVCLVTN